MKPKISLIVAADENNAIGRAGGLPWHLPADLAFFKAMTLTKPIIMGRKTYESLGRPLPKRRNIVVSSMQGILHPDVRIVSSLEDAIKECSGEQEIMVIGGGQIYRNSLHMADRIYITRVHTKVENADTFFPVFDETSWDKKTLEEHPANEDNKYAFTILEYNKN